MGAAFPIPGTNWREILHGQADLGGAPLDLGCAKFNMNRFNESLLWGENADLWAASQFNTGSFPFGGIVPVKKN